MRTKSAARAVTSRAAVPRPRLLTIDTGLPPVPRSAYNIPTSPLFVFAQRTRLKHHYHYYDMILLLRLRASKSQQQLLLQIIVHI